VSSPAPILERLDRLELHLETIERKLDSLSGPPPAYAYKLDEAAKMLSMGRTKLLGLIRSRKLSTVTLGGRRYVPVSELIRLTTPLQPSRRPGPMGPRPRRCGSKSEAEKIRELIRRKD
jgi:hypothetical protein